MSLERALSLLRGHRRRDETDPTETASAEPAANGTERSGSPVDDRVTPPAGNRSGPRWASEPPTVSLLPQASDTSAPGCAASA
jgi:hypothetical protein